MDTTPPSPHHKPTLSLAVLSVRSVASRMMRVFGRRKPFTDREALQSLRHLSDRELRDVGMWREPERRTDTWWSMTPPP
jgi:hypothetical protein